MKVHLQTLAFYLFARDKFPIQKEVRQGDTISPKLCTDSLECAFKNHDRDNIGLRINEESLKHLRFADVIVLLSDLQNSSKQCSRNYNEKAQQMG